jgi:hypothetical protein
MPKVHVTYNGILYDVEVQNPRAPHLASVRISSAEYDDYLSVLSLYNNWQDRLGILFAKQNTKAGIEHKTGYELLKGKPES